MAYRRSLSIRSTLFSRRFNPSFSYLSHYNDQSKQEDLQPSGSGFESYVDQRRSFGSFLKTNVRQFSGSFHRTGSMLADSGLYLNRYMSTTVQDDKINVSDGVNVITDAPMDTGAVLTDVPMEGITSHASVMSEIALAAADSAYPVAALQYLIGFIHSCTGLNWWVSISLATVVIRTVIVPFLISTLKSTAKLKLIMEEIKAEMDMDPQAVAEGQKKMKALFAEHGVTPFTPLKGMLGMLIQGPIFISFYLAIQNLVEGVPSLKNGGAFWFTDLTSPDSTFTFPILMVLTCLATVEINMLVGREGNPFAGTMKKFARGLAVLAGPFTMGFPNAMFCYWITSNVFSCCYGSIMKAQGVKKALGIPEIPVSDSKNTRLPPSFLEMLKQAASKNNSTPAKSAPVQKPDKKTTTSSTAALTQRLRDLEKQVNQKKGRKKKR